MLQRFPVLAVFFLAIILSWNVADAQQNPVRPQPSQCQAIAQSLPKATFVSFSPPGPTLANDPVNGDVKITFLDHATLFIETPGGVSIATDYSGAYPPPYTPEVVTMNKAHPSHYTLTPDPAIKYVLHGWSDVPGEPAKIRMTVGDTLIRNVVTDIRPWGGGIEANGNSIFIFEVAGLCIGHLGHLHFELTDQQYAEIGRLDVVMVPVDGGLTMGADSMSRVVKRLRSSLILPMHRWGPPVDQFLALFGPDFDVGYAPTASVTVSVKTLPRKPLIYVLKGL
ncbi:MULTISPECIES: MBL fold metallo-hydrolase [unclassified Rhizobium]|uniref:MBL fold metallo-hydrolase n=1 Tax=unclassified Rhizobium TaxID=2613769 RepID=UPI000DDDDAAC|nr:MULTISPECIES: MBL fold metallo-hydrolase [unclassified Rhizobium]MBB3289986.1 L-ascorbate metabolism protein UlaG (beta-lactamase superfamily) [Rhizobium sp. BK252]MBB3404768.1 L-ascorbate metabolism protein UlaG (beta-lactamase superfamily) [Rhizobium sp. BK289]MBB3417354.1 L-ascorbate metabolism protein UlaG (beta-lactamase superfamily) [Rhizobium sp. BK284]MBB3485343.1 L-ascorbate metabolism protein UlaG (beta-lactamase superfamily) [Rhizobium sp. BK347]MDK4722487.1 MBL fold metallo-hydr